MHTFLGVEVGSVSTDLCLLSPEGEVLDGIYLRTRGDPVGVLREGLDILRRRTCGNLRVLGTGTTGSGRHLAGPGPNIAAAKDKEPRTWFESLWH